jgi:hypothetical protein
MIKFIKVLGIPIDMGGAIKINCEVQCPMSLKGVLDG